MDSLQLRSTRPAGRPGTQDEPAGSGVKAPELRPAVSAGTAQGTRALPAVGGFLGISPAVRAARGRPIWSFPQASRLSAYSSWANACAWRARRAALNRSFTSAWAALSAGRAAGMSERSIGSPKRTRAFEGRDE